MKKTSKNFICDECGYLSFKWFGRCPSCGKWDSLQEGILDDLDKKNINFTNSYITKLSDVNLSNNIKIKTNINNFDTILGGGIIPGSFILFAGEPGIGKSTLILQVLLSISLEFRVLYNNAEESNEQIKLRSDRINKKNRDLNLLQSTNFNDIVNNINTFKPNGIVIDSIQTIYCENIQGLPGSITQVKQIATNFMRIAKDQGIFVILVGHITKDGNIAGPKALEHMVDVVLYLEGDSARDFRILRSYKNRFASTNRIAIFRMFNDGLNEVDNPSEYLIRDYNFRFCGTVLSVIYEGNRPLMIEIQALVSDTHFVHPKRMSDGIDVNKVYKLIAILEKSVGVILSKSDIYVNLVGDLKLRESAIELAVLMAIYSSFKKITYEGSIACIGEIGLAGEIRSVSNTAERVDEALRFGIDNIFLSRNSYSDSENLHNFTNNTSIKFVSNVSEMIDFFN